MFFVPRLRTLNGWMWRLVWFVGISLVIGVLLQFFVGLKPWTAVLMASAGFGLFITCFWDLLHIQREVWITDHAIEWRAGGGQYWITGSYLHANTARLEFLRPGEWPFRFGGLCAHLHDGQTVLFAVPKGKRLETMATILTRMELDVSLSGWEPTTTDTRTRVDEELVFDPETRTRDAVFLPIPADEPKLLSKPANLLASIIGVFPLLIAFFAMIATWVYLGMNWSQFDFSKRVLIAAGGFGILVLGFLYLQFIGQFIERSVMIWFLEKGIRLRVNPLVNSEDDDVYIVSLFRREYWTKIVSKSSDFGYLQFSRRKAALVFEGDNERWTIPVSALTALRIEEAAVGKEGGENPEVRYFVVIGTYRDDENWEIGLVRARTKWGNDNAKARRARMGVLFDDLRMAISTNSI